MQVMLVMRQAVLHKDNPVFIIYNKFRYTQIAVVGGCLFAGFVSVMDITWH
jgi:hypothetical protein